nr:hypothetical protein [Tanacetum cinerariifolium]
MCVILVFTRYRLHESDVDTLRHNRDFRPSPKGTPYWVPDLEEDEKPQINVVFDSFEAAYDMYKAYADKGIFSVRKSGRKKLRVAFMGGYDKVRGTPSDYRNYRREVNLFIGDKDAQMIVDKMINRKQHVPEFSFEHHVHNDELKCVTFGAALLFDETKDSYTWMLTFFFKVHGKQPPLALTDQDAALRNAVVKIFSESKHRLETDRLASEVHATIEDCVGLLRNNTKKLTEFLTTVKDMKKKLEADMPTSNDHQSKENIYADLLGVTIPAKVVINNPQKSSNKGSKRKKKVRLKLFFDVLVLVILSIPNSLRERMDAS